MNAKRIAAERAVEYIQDGMIVGLGTGSTAYWAILKLASRVQDGLDIRAIATSTQSEMLAKEHGIPFTSFSEITEIDITIDGADEVNPELHLIKGGGGALLREKIVAASSRQFIVVVDESKLVDTLGKFPLPVEIIPFGYETTMKRLQQLGCEPVLRINDDRVFITDNGNYIVDCSCMKIDDPQDLHQRINQIPGVVDNGLFVKMASRVIVGSHDGDINIVES